jgi:hypothetical protein
MTRSWWTDRFNYSEEYFQILNIAGGIFFILVGIASLIAAFFRNSENKLPTSLEHLFMGIIGTVFIGGFLLIIFLNIRFRKTK